MSGGDGFAKEPLTGRFRLADEPGTTAQGALDMGSGMLRLEAELVPCLEPIVESPTMTSFNHRRDVNTTYLVLGEVDDGTTVSLARVTRGSCSHQGDCEWQEFRALRCFLGDHVTEETEYETAEVVIDSPWSTWLPGVDVAADVEIAGVGIVTVTVRDGRLVARGSAMTAEQWARRATNPFCALLMLISGHDVTVSETVLGRPGEAELLTAADAPTTWHRRLWAGRCTP